MLWAFHLEGAPQRVNHAAVAVGDKIYSFGGYFTEFAPFLFIDVYCFDTNILQWSKVRYSPNTFTPRGCFGHTVVEHRGLIYLWGGQNNFTACNTLYCFDPKKSTWKGLRTSGQVPPAADGHSACVISNHMYVFGGFEDSEECFSESVHRINLETFRWELLNTSGSPPSRRDFHTATAVGSRMYVFGGRSSYTADTENEFYSNDMIYLDTKQMLWVRPMCEGKPPSGRRSHSAVNYQNNIYVMGGLEGGSGLHLNDMHRFTPYTNQWTEMAVRGLGPTPRRRHCSVVVCDQLYLFGGSSPCPTRYSVDNENALREHSDLYVMDFLPTLQRLCQVAIIQNGLDTHQLSYLLQREIRAMTARPPQTQERSQTEMTADSCNDQQ